MVDIIEERIVIEMYHKEGESTNERLGDELKYRILEEGYKLVGTDFTPKNGIKFYFSKED